MKFSTAASVILFSPATVLAASNSKAGKTTSSSVTTTASKAGKAFYSHHGSYSYSMSVDTNMPTVAPTATFEPTATPSYPPTFHPTTGPSTKPSFSPSISLQPTVTEPPSDLPSQSQTPTISAAPTPDPMICGRSYSGDDVVVYLNRDLECRQDNTIPGPDAAFTLSNGATLDCGGYELSMRNDVNIRYGVKLIDTASVRNCGVSKFVKSNARIEAQNANTFSIINSSFSSSEFGVFVAQDNNENSRNVIVLKDVTANSNDSDGIYFSGQSDSLKKYDEPHTIKLEGEIRANNNGRNGMGLAWTNIVQVYGKVELKNNGQSFLNCPWCSVGGFYVLFPGTLNMTLIGDDTTFTSCNNTVYDMVNRNPGQELHPDLSDSAESVFFPEEGESWVYDTQNRPDGGKLPKNPQPCSSVSELI